MFRFSSFKVLKPQPQRGHFHQTWACPIQAKRETTHSPRPSESQSRMSYCPTMRKRPQAGPGLLFFFIRAVVHSRLGQTPFQPCLCSYPHSNKRGNTSIFTFIKPFMPHPHPKRRYTLHWVHEQTKENLLPLGASAVLAGPMHSAAAASKGPPPPPVIPKWGVPMTALAPLKPYNPYGHGIGTWGQDFYKGVQPLHT